jgi:ethanolamine ammonia-lyase small subunit
VSDPPPPDAAPPSAAARAPERTAERLWARLRQATAARIGLARSGASLATQPLLEFRLAHAQARDAVHAALDAAALGAALAALGPPPLVVDSAAGDRRTYLMRPDLGRRLGAAAAATLSPHAGRHDLAVVIADGLSAHAAERHAPPLLAAALPALAADGWRIAPPVIARQGRVALGDAIAGALGARAVALLIGERPGLSAPDSLGAYLTWQPGPRTSDAERNCISNVRPAGISYQDAAFRLVYLLRQMRVHRLSGVRLKDDSARLLLDGSAGR